MSVEESFDLDQERQKTLPPRFEVEINFDSAQKAWRSNKKQYGGCFQYRCGLMRSNGSVCRSKPQIIRKEEQRRRRLTSVNGSQKSLLYLGSWSPCWWHQKFCLP